MILKHILVNKIFRVCFLISIFLLIFTTLDTQSISAHGFGERYDLPVPLNLYLLGSAITILISFLIIVAFFKVNTNKKTLAIYIPIPKTIFFYLKSILSTIFLLIFFLFIISGFIGNPLPLRNITPILLWIILWIGTMFVSSMIFNLWPTINPWKTMFEIFEKIIKKIITKNSISTLNFEYPKQLGMWPGVILLFLFVWIENVHPASSSPRLIAMLATLYSLLTLTGMFYFGKNIWLKNAEFFSIFFHFVSRFSPLHISENSPKNTSENNLIIKITLYGSKVISSKINSFSELCFILLMVSSITFDGLKETPIWNAIDSFTYQIHPQLTPVPIKSLGLLGTFFGFSSMYFVFSWLMKRFSETSLSPETVAKLFATSLLPIAIGYHIAHYFSYLIIQGQILILLISDPFGFNWNLFGTADYTINISILNAKFAWFLGISAIVIGHIFAVIISHVIALNNFNKNEALKSQYPMLILMILYTIFSLWIIAQPIVT